MAMMQTKAGNGVTLAKTARILPDVSKELAEMRAEMARLRADNERLKAQPKVQGRPFRMKIGEKRGVSVYGYGRFPVTLYAPAWLDLLDNHADEIKAFIQANRSNLSWSKDD